MPLQAINGLGTHCSGRFSLLNCQAACQGVILTYQGDVFGYCRKHAVLIREAVLRRGFTIHSFLHPQANAAPFVATGPPVKLEGPPKAEPAARPPEPAVDAARRELGQTVELLNAVGDVNLRQAELLEQHAIALARLRMEFELPAQEPAHLAASVIAMMRQLVQDRSVERRELLAALQENADLEERLRFLEASIAAYRAD